MLLGTNGEVVYFGAVLAHLVKGLDVWGRKLSCCLEINAQHFKYSVAVFHTFLGICVVNVFVNQLHTLVRRAYGSDRLHKLVCAKHAYSCSSIDSSEAVCH